MPDSKKSLFPNIPISRRSFIGKTTITLAGIAALKSRAFALAAVNSGLKDVFRDDFYIGTAINTGTLLGNDEEMLGIVKREFNAITAANAFKWAVIHPSEEEWRYRAPDRFIEFGQTNNMYMVGHVLVWHSQAPRSLFTDEAGKQVDKDVLFKRLENHIVTLVGRYKGKINTWDVVNEAFTPEDGWRPTPWYKIAGPEFMERAFRLAHETDPKACLLYNDYNMADPRRRELVVSMIRQYKKNGVPVHGIGMQGHVALDYPDLAEFEASIVAFAAEGMQVHITELDVDVLPSGWENRGAEISTNFEYDKKLDPYKNGLPPEIEGQLTRRYEGLFRIFLKHRDKIERVTFWGTSDDESWKNNFPVRGRTNYPLLFDREHKPKKAYETIVALKR